MNFKYSVVKYFAICFVFIAVAACSKTTYEEHMKNAEQALSDKSYGRAVIELKNVLQKVPDNKKARILIGQVYLQVGDGASAEKEFNRYIEYGGEESQVFIFKAKAMYLQHNYEALLAYLKKGDYDNAVALNIKGQAKIRLGVLDEASQLFNRALSIQSNFIDAKLGLAEVAVIKRNYSEALSKINDVIILSENDRRALYLKGRVLLLQGKPAEAVPALTKAAKTLNGKVYGEEQLNIQVFLIQSLIQNKQYKMAVPHIKTLSRFHPKILVTYYFNGLLAYLDKQYDEAEIKFNEVLKIKSDHMSSLLLLGTIHYVKGNFEQANNYLTKFVSNAPSHLQARKLLATVRVKLNRHAEALAVLTETSGDRDDELISMMGQLAVQSGQQAYAINILKQASDKTTDQTIRSTLAAAYLKRGQYDNAIQELDGLSDKNEQQQLMLIDAYLKSNKINQAKELLKEITKERPDSEITQVVAGIVALYSGERIEAKNFFNEALKIKPGFIHPRLYLASMQYADGNLDDARRLYDMILVQDENNVSAYLGLAQIAEKKGNLNQALDLLKEINTKNKTNLFPAVVLGSYYIRRQDHESALKVLMPAQQANPDNVKINLLLSYTYRKLGKPDRSVTLLNALLQTNQKNVLVYIELAGVLQERGESRKAKETLSKALRIKPGSIRAKHALGLLEMKRGATDSALKIARELQLNEKSAFIGYILSGDIYLQLEKYVKAQQSYQSAMNRQSNTYVLLKLYSSYNKAGQKRQAFELIDKWVKLHPNDLLVGLDLATLLIERGKQADAIKEYKRMLSINNQHIPSLNNLAMLYADDQSDQALRYAQQAYDIASSHPAIQDTLGWAYAKNGQLKRGLELLRKAARKSSDPSIHYHLAYVLHKSGQSAEARNVIVKVLSGKLDFSDVGNSKALLKEIDNTINNK